MIIHKSKIKTREVVENFFKNDQNIESYFYEESENGPDKFHVVFKDEVNGPGYADWMTWHLQDVLNITNKTVIISTWADVDSILDNVIIKK